MPFKSQKVFLFFVFTALILVKASAFHVYTHHDDDTANDIEHCFLCDTIIENQSTPLLNIAHDIKTTCVIDIVFYKKNYKTIIASISSGVTYKLYGRPPPITA